MEATGLSGTDALALMNNRDGYSDGSWFWILILLFAFWGNGFNRNNELETDIDTRFLERDIFNTNQNVSNTACTTQRDVLENRYSLGTEILENRYNCSQNACSTQKEILQNRYDNALQTNTLQAQIQNCCCELRAESLANTQKVLDKMCETEINTLRDKLADRDRDLQTAYNQISQVAQTNSIVNQLRPYPIPAYQTTSPYVGYGLYGYGCGCANSNVI